MMDKFKELQEQHQQSPKEANPFLTSNEPVDEVVFGVEPDESPVLPQELGAVQESLTVAEVGSETKPNSEVNEQSIDPRDGMFEPEVIDNLPSQDEGEE